MTVMTSALSPVEAAQARTYAAKERAWRILSNFRIATLRNAEIYTSEIPDAPYVGCYHYAVVVEYYRFGWKWTKVLFYESSYDSYDRDVVFAYAKKLQQDIRATF